MKGIINTTIKEGYLFNKIFKSLQQTQFYSKEKIDDYQNEELKKIVNHAYKNVPYYNKIFNQLGVLPGDIKNKEDLNKLPLLTKNDVKENFGLLKAKNAPKFLLNVGHTSGTTGTPAHFYRDIYSINFENAIVWRQWNNAEITKKSRKAVLRGDIIVPENQKVPPFWKLNKFENKLYLSSFHLSSENLPFYINKLKEYQPECLQAYPSTAYTLAKHLDHNNEYLNLKAIFTSSEPLYSYQRELIEERMNCKIWDFYGMAERVISASECSEHSGLHINEEYGITEFIGGPSQNEGIMVGTSLHNYAMPLIRYVTNDYGKISNEKCTCGSQHRLLCPIETKQEDMIITKEGKWISPSIITHAFKPLTHVKKSQVIQHELDRYEILLVPEHGFDDNEKLILLQGLKQRFGSTSNIEINLVKDIPRTKNGKFRWVISKVIKERV
jgi:phenylacetate-CoA ligase